MKKNAQRILSAFLAALILSVAAFPAYAVSSGNTLYDTIDFYTHVYGIYRGWRDGHPDTDYSEYPGFRAGGFGSDPDKFGGGSFGGGAGRKAYDDYVTTLPAQGYNSDGGLTWSPKVAYWAIYASSTAHSAKCSHVPESVWGISDPNQLASFDCENLFFTDRAINEKTELYAYRFYLHIEDKYPIDGYYTRLPSLQIKASYITTKTPSETKTFESSYTSVASTLFYAGEKISRNVDFNGPGYCRYISGYVYPYTYSIVPFNSSSLNTTYNITTRPTSITGGNYGIVGDNNQMTKVEDNSTIVNETNNTYYNPATGVTVPITNWSYDYSDRSYKVDYTTSNTTGDTVTNTSTITYGDEYITIQEIDNSQGDTITNNYTIYYLIDGSGSEPVDPPAPCEHTWTETSTTPATCTMPGSKLSTCSKCQQTKKEAVPALGHDWQVKQTVTTEYDDTGQLVQQGYTIFECSRCHEQYKSTDGTAPPGGGSGTDPGEEKETIWQKIGKLFGIIGDGVIGMIEAAVSKVLDGLISLAEMLVEKLKTVVETVLSIFDELPLLFGGFLDFLAAVFPFLPPELMTVLTFGIIAVVFIAIIKAVWR